MTAEEKRLEEARTHQQHWRRWGPYLSERQWGTVREDYSKYGTAWDYFPHDHARSRAYRWGEDGIAGISDNHQRLCFAIALWNGKDPILKERIFGLTGPEGNHGEDVKEYYFYLDNTPSHAYMKYLYKYTQQEFPYNELVAANRDRSKTEPEFELLDTGIFDNNDYFDVFVEYAKASTEDILIQIHVVNRGNEEKPLHLLPTLWFRNTWSWDKESEKPYLKIFDSISEGNQSVSIIESSHPTLGKYWLYCANPGELLFTENETNFARLFGVENESAYLKDGINDYIINGLEKAVVPNKIGTKFSAAYYWKIGAGESKTIQLRLSENSQLTAPFGEEFQQIFAQRQQEADEFYHKFCPANLSPDLRNVQRQAFAGLLWTKQYYHYVVEDWLEGDRNQPDPNREVKRNQEWIHLYNDDILSMPDKWEFPWFAAWDLAFHVLPLATIDPDFAKRQLDRLTREWYMHPNGQIPAYEWQFSDVNPPVHAWGAWRVYQIEKQIYGRSDRHFLESVFQKLLLNFTWWVNRKDEGGNNVFQGGFLGLDNIGIFDRSAELPMGGHLDQSDGTSWMGMYSLNMLAIALELAQENPAYEDMASKFFEHFLYIADAMNHIGDTDIHLWDEQDGFYYDVLQFPQGDRVHLKVRSMVGLVPLFAVKILTPEILAKVPHFKRRMDWFIQNRPDLKRNIACMETKGVGARRILSIVNQDKLKRILQKMLDENEFLSDYGIRSLSKFHQKNPYIFECEGNWNQVNYEAAESTTGMFGGNSNWRGPIWFPMNFLIIESLRQFHEYLGDDFKVEYPTNSGHEMNLKQIADEISQRLIAIFAQNSAKQRPVYTGIEKFQTDPNWQNLIVFHEYFNGDTGAGLGANHQTGWTGLIAKLVQDCG
ncbi:MGH1-like glycoside hydrolase domain-containing protein [Floridanema aerugineum]|uniref:Glucosidase n=1 Tax=Floridaenema aerugineum BLCC-F46 TaxID=3153654 RepID=A0ABV4X394_9CYAN